MFPTIQSTARAVVIAGGAIALSALSLSAIAADAAQQQSVDASAAQIVVRDADTGALRAATPDEAAALKGSNKRAALRVAPASTLARYHASGARGARLTDDFMTYSVLVRQPDGTFAELCFDSREAAEAAVKSAPVAKTSTLPTE